MSYCTQPLIDNTAGPHLSNADTSQVTYASGRQLPLETGNQGQSPSLLYNSDIYANNGSIPQGMSQVMTAQPHNFQASTYHPPQEVPNSDNVYYTHRFLTTSRDEEAARIHALENQIRSVEGQIDHLKQELEKCRQNYLDKSRAVQTFESVTGLGSWNNVATGDHYQSGFSASGSGY